MFGRLASFVQQAAEVIAPTASKKDDFVHHWKSVAHFLVDQKDERLPVQATSVPDHLTEMVELLCQEEEEGDGVTGPCMEYLLQHKILETLHTLGRADRPPGMKQQVLRFFTSVISRAKQPLLPNIHVHKPVQRLIHCCADSRASPTETDEVHFLCTVASNLKQHPHLASVFLESRPTSTTAETTSAASTKTSREDSTIADGDHSKFYILSALLELSRSEDRRVSLKACEGMLLCASLDNESIARSISNNSPFCQILADRVQSTFASIPTDLQAQKILSCTAKWGMEGGLDEEEHYEGRTELRAWLSWLDYFDQLVIAAHPTVGKALTECLQERFFRTQIEPRLSQMSECGLVVSTALVTKLVEALHSPLSVHALVTLLVGAGETQLPPASDANGSTAATDQQELCSHLISRCDHVNDELSLVSLQLFTLLLQKNDPLVLRRLVLRYLDVELHLKSESRGKGHLELITALLEKSTTSGTSTPAGKEATVSESSAVPSPAVSQSSVDDGRESAASAPSVCESDTEGSEVGKPSSPTTTSLPSSPAVSEPSTPLSIPSTPTLDVATPDSKMVTPFGRVVSQSPSELEPVVQLFFAERNHAELVVNTFLTLLPETAKTSLHMPSSGYDEYIRDAQEQVLLCFAACRDWQELPKEGDENDAGEFSEGPFLRLLFNKLQRALDQPYEINLAVTGLLTRLAYFPQRHLHAYLLDPFVPLRDNARSLHNVLQQISAELTVRARRAPSFQENVLKARHRLCGTAQVDAVDLHKDNIYEAVVLLEEFCKELAAVAFVKSAAYLQERDIA